ncbi:TIGR01777 family oxidoreductase [Luteipulveratus sp. YIM 133132]|uniref:TIGR01777 family oxidoreductase n=1 Tax=Luteipulveratus flavus TaxID=3031728 RepID=A0ABT6C5T9_9MICO|nr:MULTISPECIES: TIGR01777 family oxidoreductase [unclassified Luteipulveratus]MDE9366441.1 TIGR01777 family oxidoreductase [Luteipulveratus sp. YIM 133132]MDF8264284.1 TIGR01777 family oxidoreductase [Luteipulveratus sp. YIM 133296]
MTQRVAITGSSGLIGGALSSSLRDRGDEVVHLVRRPAREPHEVTWDPSRHQLDPAALEGVTAVVNLAGAGVGDHRWTDSYKRTLVRSRLDSTSTVVDAMTAQGHPIRLVSGSAMGYYGNRGDDDLDETSAKGDGFLADLVRDWEAAAAPAVEAGCPTAFVRTSLVLSRRGGVLQRIATLARLGLNGPLGNGRQWWSWISLTDEVRAIVHLIDHPEVTGPVNLSAPEPVRQKDFAHALGRAVHRPAVLPAPAFALRVVLGEMVQDILGSQRLRPSVLEQQGFTWEHPGLDEALRGELRD